MANNYHWDKQSPNPSHDVENASLPINTGDSAISSTGAPAGNTRPEGSSRSISRTKKLGFVVVSLSFVVVLVMTLALQHSSSSGYGGETEIASASAITPSSPTSEISISNTSPNEADDTPTGQSPIETKLDDFNSIKPEYYTSVGPLKARVKVVSPSIVNGYESCSDLERDMTEAMKLYMNAFIMNEALSGENYANCDPENENWLRDLHGNDYDYFFDVNDACSPTSNNTDLACATDSTEVPWVVTWHVIDHAEGKLFYNENEARVEYDRIDSQWFKRLYDPSKNIKEETGSLHESRWCQLETWAYKAQCNGNAPSAVKTRKSMVTQSRSRNPSAPTHSDTGNRKGGSKIGDTTGDSHGLNNQINNANEHDRVLSDGTYVYAAYGDVLYVWAADDMMRGVSITKMPVNDTACDGNVTEACVTTSKPTIRALFLGNSRLTVIISQTSSIYPTENKTQHVIPHYNTKTYVLVYDISDFSLGSPLGQVGYSELTGTFFNGRSIGDKTILATESFMDTWVLVEDLSRSQSQYCGLDNQSYMERAAEIATANVQSFAERMVADLELVNDCSNIFQVSMLQSSSDESDASMADMNTVNILGRFVQVSAFDMTSDLGEDGDISIAVSGAFTPGFGGPVYLADDFLAVPIDSYGYSSIFGFDLSTEAGAVPFCYGQVPGNIRDNYRIDMWDGHLRVATTNYVHSEGDRVSTHVTKMYVLEVPSIQGGPGMMSLVGEADISGDVIHGTRFVNDKAYVYTSDWTGYNGMFQSVDLSDHLNPQVAGNLAINGSLSYYLQEIIIDNITYILGIGQEIDSLESHMKLSLFDISIPSSLKFTASYSGAAGTSSIASGDFLAVRYLPETMRLIIPVSKNDGTENYNDGFTVYDISKDSFTPAFRVTHSTINSYCGYEARIPARSFLFQSKLTTVMGHTVISTEMHSGNFTSGFDLDVGLNYSVCEPWLPIYDDYFGFDYNDVDEEALDACNIPDYVQADIVDICTDAKYASRSWVFHQTSMSLCSNGTYFEDSMGNVSSVEECAQKCMEKQDGRYGLNLPREPVRGFQFVCDGSCACLVASDEVTDLNFNASVASGCYAYAYSMSAAVNQPEGLDDAYGC
ncbi:hypothetical protein ACHAW6_006647 [Cyclotella cf. meneghiniana]